MQRRAFLLSIVLLPLTVLACDTKQWHLSLSTETSLQKRGLRLGRLSQWLYPSYSYCSRCLTTWNLVDSKDVRLTDDMEDRALWARGFFSLCVACWEETTVDERVEYTRRSFNAYWANGDIPWSAYEVAVRRESLKGTI